MFANKKNVKFVQLFLLRFRLISAILAVQARADVVFKQTESTSTLNLWVWSEPLGSFALSNSCSKWRFLFVIFCCCRMSKDLPPGC